MLTITHNDDNHSALAVVGLTPWRVPVNEDDHGTGSAAVAGLGRSVRLDYIKDKVSDLKNVNEPVTLVNCYWIVAALCPGKPWLGFSCFFVLLCQYRMLYDI